MSERTVAESVGMDVSFASTGTIVVNAEEYERLKAELAAHEDALAAAQTLVDAMETCHQCKGTVLVEDGPVHCEDCSYDCDSHEGSECPTIYGLHLALKKSLVSCTRLAPPADKAGA